MSGVLDPALKRPKADDEVTHSDFLVICDTFRRHGDVVIDLIARNGAKLLGDRKHREAWRGRAVADRIKESVAARRIPSRCVPELRKPQVWHYGLPLADCHCAAPCSYAMSPEISRPFARLLRRGARSAIKASSR